MRSCRSTLLRPTVAAVAFAALVAFAFAPLAFAESPQTGADDVTASDTVAADDAAPAVASEDAPLRRHQCLRSTGSLITASRNYRAQREGKAERCAPGFGRVYTSEDLSRTGHTDLGSALRALDTSIH